MEVKELTRPTKRTAPKADSEEAEVERAKEILLQRKVQRKLTAKESLADFQEGSFVTVRGTGQRGIVQMVLTSGFCVVKPESGGDGDGVVHVQAKNLFALDNSFSRSLPVRSNSFKLPETSSRI
jgi:hypothetical protein